MGKLKVMTIVGTRPEIIRLSRVICKLDRVCDHVLVHTGQNYDYKVSIEKIKNVFKLLINETPFLVDDKAMQECQGKS